MPYDGNRKGAARMNETESAGGLLARGDQPLIGVLVEENGRSLVRYYTEEAAADAALPNTAVGQALAAIGSWRDLDFDETLDALDRIRHESTPTPAIELAIAPG
jgi:hypothetical protein